MCGIDFLVGKIMGCEYEKIKVEHPTSGACRCMKYCKKYKQYCFKQCEKKDRIKK